MNDFQYHVPTKIVFGKGHENDIGQILKKDKIEKVILLYGSGSIKKNGLYQRVVDSLSKAEIKFTEYGGIKSNPRVSDVDKAAEIARKEAVQAVLSVGGGSVMDSGKAVSAAAKCNCSAWDFYTGTRITDAIPIYNIVTLAATASEMNSGFVLTNEITKEKFGNGSPLLAPRLSIMNPELTFSVPNNYTAYSAVDIIAHALEGYLTRTSGPELTCGYIENIVRTIIRTTEIILDEPNNYDARAEFMWAATLALNSNQSIGFGGVTFPNHMIEHAVSAVHDIPHGAGLSIIIPAWMKWYQNNNPKQFSKLAQRIFNKNTIEEGIGSLEKWFSKIGAPIRFSEVNISKDSFELIAEKAVAQGQLWGMNTQYPKDKVMEILQLAE